MYAEGKKKHNRLNISIFLLAGVMEEFIYSILIIIHHLGCN